MEPKFIIDEEGKTKEIILPIKQYNKLIDELENYEDALAVAKSKLNKNQKKYTWEEVKKDMYAS